jgi:hypothetical protein
MRTGHKQGEMRLTYFSKITQPRKQNSCFCLVVCIQRSRNTGFSCYNVQLLQRAAALPYLPLDIRGPLKEDLRLLFFWGALAYALGLEAFAFCFGLFGMGSIRKGKELLKRKELLKGNC